MDAEITIQKAGSKQLSAALEFVQAAYKRKLGTQPRSIWEDCLVALAGCKIVGVVALQFSEGQGFEVEDQFLFGFSTLVHPRERFVSLGRWTALHPGVGAALMCAAMLFALGRQRTRQVSCSRGNVLNFLRNSYHLKFDTLHVPVCREKIRPEDFRFFMSRPPPCLCVSSVQEWYDCLRPQISQGIKILI